MFVHKKGHRFIALMLVMALCLSLLTTVGLADETTEPAGPKENRFAASFVDPSTMERRDAKGYNGMVVSANPTATAIGLEILQKGGNAADAAVAVAFALGLGEPAASGIGSSGLTLYYDAETKKVTALDYNSACPAGLTIQPFDHIDTTTRNNYFYDPAHAGAAATVTGTVAGMTKLNELYGSMSLAEIFEPVIELAEVGAPISPYSAGIFNDYIDRILRYPEMTKVYTDGGFPYMEGQLFVNPEYADTLRIIAEKGHDGFYKGEVAQSIVDAVQKHGGFMTMDDLASYEVDVSEAMTIDYRGYTIAGTRPSGTGAVVLAELQLAERFPLAKYGHNSTEFLHVWSEIFKLTIADYSWVGDAKYYDQAGVEGMISEAYANLRAKEIKMDSSISGATGNYPYLYAPPDTESHTSHFVVVDKWGNATSTTHTNASFWGSYIVPENRGFVLQNYRNFEVGSAYQPRPGMKTKNPMTPTMILNPDGTFYAAYGCPGSERIHTTNALIASNLIDFGMDIQEAIDAPRLYDRRNELTLEVGIEDLDTKIQELKELGHTEVRTRSYSNFFGGVHAVTKDPVTGELHGGADKRRDGVAMGY